MKYIVVLKALKEVEIEANSEDEAIEVVKSKENLPSDFEVESEVYTIPALYSTRSSEQMLDKTNWYKIRRR